MKKTLLTLTLALLFGMSAFGQTILTTTTLSNAVPGPNSSALSTGNQQLVVVASATGISAPAPNTSNVYGPATSAAQSYLFVDRELMQVASVSSTTIGVIRGVGSTAVSSHAASALVFVIPAAYLGGGNSRFGSIPQGSCTRANEQFLPYIHFSSGVISDCNGGQWINGDAFQTQRVVNGSLGLRLPDPGGVAYTSLETAGTAAGATTEEYCTELDMPYSMLVTGLGILNGTTATTDNRMVILRDAGGKVLRTSAAAGALAATASIYQKHAFTAPYYVVGPGRYFGCFQANGTTVTQRHMITAVNDNVFAGKLTGQTFGTAVDATMPSSFTTALGPYLLVY